MKKKKVNFLRTGLEPMAPFTRQRRWSTIQVLYNHAKCIYKHAKCIYLLLFDMHTAPTACVLRITKGYFFYRNTFLFTKYAGKDKLYTREKLKNIVALQAQEYL